MIFELGRRSEKSWFSICLQLKMIETPQKTLYGCQCLLRLPGI